MWLGSFLGCVVLEIDVSGSVVEWFDANGVRSAQVEHVPRILHVHVHPLRWYDVESCGGRGSPAEVAWRLVLLVVPHVEPGRRDEHGANVSNVEGRRCRVETKWAPFLVGLAVRECDLPVPSEIGGIVDRSPWPFQRDVAIYPNYPSSC